MTIYDEVKVWSKLIVRDEVFFVTVSGIVVNIEFIGVINVLEAGYSIMCLVKEVPGVPTLYCFKAFLILHV